MSSDFSILQERYKVVRQLGRGGMGAVYEAIDLRFGSIVALKQMTITGDSLVKAFEREAKLLNNLRHAALPVVIDYFTEGSGQYLVMQYIPGEDLAQMLSNNGGPFPAETIADWANQLLSALEFLHTRKPPIIHRDIKPQNLKVTPEGDLILLDFGLAKGSAGQMTRSTRSIGGYTPQYAALEQMRGQGTDAKSDLYSVAATLYHLLSGRLPVDALTRADAVINRLPDPLPSLVNIGAPVAGAVSDVISQTMALPRDERPPSASALSVMLADAFGNERAGASNRRRRTLVEHETLPFTRIRPDSGADTHETERTQLLLGGGAAASPSSLPEPSSSATTKALSNETDGQSSAPRRLWITVAALALAVGLLVVASVMAVSLYPRFMAARNVQPAPTEAPPRAPSSGDASERFDVVRFRLETNEVTPLDTAASIAVGTKFKFRFEGTEPGYLYLLAPDEKGDFTSWLTNEPAPATLVSTNRIEAGKALVFPGGKATLGVNAGETRFVVVFSSSKDVVPEALKARSLQRVPDDIRQELQRLRESSGEPVTVDETGSGGWQTARAPRASSGSPLVFEIVLRGGPR